MVEVLIKISLEHLFDPCSPAAPALFVDRGDQYIALNVVVPTLYLFFPFITYVMASFIYIF